MYISIFKLRSVPEVDFLSDTETLYTKKLYKIYTTDYTKCIPHFKKLLYTYILYTKSKELY